MHKKILHLVINYNSDNDVKNLIMNLCEQSSIQFVKLVVLSNTKVKDDSLKKICQQKSIDLFELNENLGYFGAANDYLEKSKYKNDYSWTIVSNADLSILNTHFYQELIQLRQDNLLGLIAPRIVSRLTGINSNPLMNKRPSSIKMLFYKYVFRYRVISTIYVFLGYLKAVLTNKLFKKKITLSNNTEIYAAHGSFFIFSSNVFKFGGSLKMNHFLYGEEIYIAEILKKMNLKSYYRHDFEVFHIEHGSTSIWSYFFSSKMFEYRKNAAESNYNTFFRNQN